MLLYEVTEKIVPLNFFCPNISILYIVTKNKYPLEFGIEIKNVPPFNNINATSNFNSRWLIRISHFLQTAKKAKK